MTVQDAIQAYPALDEISANALEVACINRDVSASATYTRDLKSKTELVIADLLTALANSPDYKDGDSGQTYPRETLLKNAGKLYRANGVADPNQPTITDRTNIW